MFVVTIFLSILNQIEFHLIQKLERKTITTIIWLWWQSKGKLSSRSYPIQCERNWKYSFLSVCSFWLTVITWHCKHTCHSLIWKSRFTNIEPVYLRMYWFYEHKGSQIVWWKFSLFTDVSDGTYEDQKSGTSLMLDIFCLSSRSRFTFKFIRVESSSQFPLWFWVKRNPSDLKTKEKLTARSFYVSFGRKLKIILRPYMYK